MKTIAGGLTFRCLVWLFTTPASAQQARRAENAAPALLRHCEANHGGQPRPAEFARQHARLFDEIDNDFAAQDSA